MKQIVSKQRLTPMTAAVIVILATQSAAWSPPLAEELTWSVVVNNADLVPDSNKLYNSYNQPSVNTNGLVVFRARSRGPQRISGVYARQMSGGGIWTVAALQALVPAPNNLGNGFVEFPSIPRIALNADLIATRGNHQPVWSYVPAGENEETRVGTSGIFAYLGTQPRTAAAKLGAVPEFSRFSVPLPESPGLAFDVFPGSPAITDEAVIAFKGNYTALGGPQTGVFYRELADQDLAGSSPTRLIANSQTAIPGLPPGIQRRFSSFGSTSPPAAADHSVVFVGLDDEESPRYGGIYLAELPSAPEEFEQVVAIGTPVPGVIGPRFSRLGDGLAYDGRFIAFWAAWGQENKMLRLPCPTEGNKSRRDFCNQALLLSNGTIVGDPLSICDGTGCYQELRVPINQGIFVVDTYTGELRRVARTHVDFDDFLFWTYSGRVPEMGEGGEDDGEFARWRSAAFVAVSGGAVAFKARTGGFDMQSHSYLNAIDGIYLSRGPAADLRTVIQTGADGTILDSMATDLVGAPLPIRELGLERDGFRGTNLVISARMGLEGTSEEEGWAGIYLTQVP